MTDDQLELMRIAARSVVEEAAVGRSVDPHRLEWAQRVLREPAADAPAPAHFPPLPPHHARGLESF